MPNSWMVALVIPLVKKLDIDPVLENFRPVSNLSFLSKIAEKVVISQLLNHCNASEHAPLPVLGIFLLPVFNPRAAHL